MSVSGLSRKTRPVDVEWKADLKEIVVSDIYGQKVLIHWKRGLDDESFDPMNYRISYLASDDHFEIVYLGREFGEVYHGILYALLDNCFYIRYDEKWAKRLQKAIYDCAFRHRSTGIDYEGIAVAVGNLYDIISELKKGLEK